MLQQNCVSSTGWFIIAAARWNPFTATSCTGGSATQTAATPTFSLAAGTYTSAQSVTISDTTSDATIYYTTDGTTPTTASTVYSGTITVSSSETIKAIAVKSGMNNSGVASAAYVINSGTPTSYTIGNFTAQFNLSSTTLTITLVPTSSSNTAANLWYTNLSSPTLLSQALARYAVGSKNASGNYVVTIPNVQLGTNNLIDLYLSTNSGDTGWVTMTVGGTTTQTVATPTFSLAAGTYTSAQSVALSTATFGATIYYTTDGTTPTASSSVYSNAITVSSSKTVKAIAVKNGMNNSGVASAAYVINSGSSSNTIGNFTAQFNLNGTTLTVTLVPTSSSNTTANLWYTNVTSPTALSQALAGYATGSKNASGNYVVTIPNVQLGTNNLIDLYLSTNSGDTGWVAMHVS